MTRTLRMAVAIVLASALLAGGMAVAASAHSSNVVRATLANGLRVIIVRDTLAPVVTTEMNYLVGSDEAPDGFPGTAHAVDGLQAHESAGSSFSLAVPAAHFAGGIKLLAANELRPAMPQQAFKTMQQREAAATAGELQTPDFLNAIRLDQALLPAQDPGLRHATPQSINALTLTDVKSYYTSTFCPDMTTMVVIGDVTPEQARAVVTETFGGWDATGDRPDTNYPAVPMDTAASQFDTPDKTAVQDQVAMAEQIALDDHSVDRYALNAGNMVLSGGFYAARLPRDLREQRGLVYTVGGQLSLDRHRGRFEVHFGSDPEKVGKAPALILQDLQQMQDAPVTPSELQ